MQSLVGIAIGAGLALLIWKATYREPKTLHQSVMELQAVNDKLARVFDPYKERGELAQKLRRGEITSTTAIEKAAESQYTQADYDKMVAKAEAAGVTSTTANAYARRAVFHYRKKNHNKALDDISRAIRDVPGNASYMAVRGNVHLGLRKYDDAIADYSRALELKPGWPEAYYNRGQIYQQKGDAAKARTDFEAALKHGHPKAAAKLDQMKAQPSAPREGKK